MKQDLKRKLTSRKFWVALIGFVTALVTAFKIESVTAEQVQLVLGSLATLVAYIIGEGLTDTASLNNKEKDDDSNAG